MFDATIGFFRALLRMPKRWLAWIGLLVMANGVAPLFFFGTLEAKIVVGAIMVGAVIQVTIFRAKGFVRLLGLGHVLWLPMVPWLLGRLDVAAPGTLFRYWLLMVIVVNSVSVVIDVTDVVRYVRGEREPQLSRASHAADG